MLGFLWTSGQETDRSLQQRKGRSRKGSRLIAVTPFTARCWRQDLNLHSLDGNQALNLTGVHLSFRAASGMSRTKLLKSDTLASRVTRFTIGAGMVEGFEAAGAFV